MREPTLTQSPNLREISRPKKHLILPPDTYVPHLASLPTRYAASTSSPSSDAIQLFDKSTLTPLQKFDSHQGGTTFLRVVENLANAQVGGKILVSSGKDGFIKVWDEKSKSCSIKLSNGSSNNGILCFDVSSDGLLIAGGAALQGEDALILYWDPRNPTAPIRTHSSTHSDDITSLHFKPQPQPQNRSSSYIPNLLLSASSDGLISTSNADEDDEDEAVIHVTNWLGCSIAQAGWLSSTPARKTSTSSEKHKVAGIWAASDMETFGTWTDELDPIQSLDLRAPSVHTQDRTWVTDYLITCDPNTASTSHLAMFMGSNEGDIALIKNEMLDTIPESDSVSSKSWTWSLQNTWTHGHKEVVRSVLWDEKNNILLTGGEDGRLNLWTEFDQQDVDMNVDQSTLGPGGRKREYQGDGDMDVDDEGSRKRRR
ncbi:WD40 repeat-like protein [Marasmius fiardii PR-910]|nr:WD40 repeat-like protein [Marasmius fiardii PR-910]